jgi:hypothetical protein
VKAGNLLLEDPKNFDRVVLIDFGLARKLPDVMVEKEEKKKGGLYGIRFFEILNFKS